MGFFRGRRIPDYNPWWEEPNHSEGKGEHWFWYHMGYDDGHAVGSNYAEKLADLEQENESLRGLMAANVRVIKQEILNEQSLTSPETVS